MCISFPIKITAESIVLDPKHHNQFACESWIYNASNWIVMNFTLITISLQMNVIEKQSKFTFIK